MSDGKASGKKSGKASGKKSGKGHSALPVADNVRHYSRREILQRVAASGAAVAATVGLGAWLLDRKPPGANETLIEIADHRVTRPLGSVDIAVARGRDVAAMVQKALAAMGGIESFVRPGERVVIKPNVGWNRLPAQAANTNPEIVAEVARLVIAAGAAEVWVTDNPVNNAERCFARSGIADAVRKAGAELILPNELSFRTVAVGGQLLRVGDVLWPFVEADRIINLPVVKQHGLCHATMAMKNWYGVLGGHRVRLHQNIDRSIVELAGMVKPTLTIMDATRVLMANGPSGGSLDDVKRFDTIVVGVDEVALDAYGSQFLDRTPSEITFIGLAEREGIGRSDYQNMKMVEIEVEG